MALKLGIIRVSESRASGLASSWMVYQFIMVYHTGPPKQIQDFVALPTGQSPVGT